MVAFIRVGNAVLGVCWLVIFGAFVFSDWTPPSGTIGCAFLATAVGSFHFACRPSADGRRG